MMFSFIVFDRYILLCISGGFLPLDREPVFVSKASYWIWVSWFLQYSIPIVKSYFRNSYYCI